MVAARQRLCSRLTELWCLINFVLYYYYILLCVEHPSIQAANNDLLRRDECHQRDILAPA